MQSAYNTAMGEEREQLPGSWEEPIVRGKEAMKSMMLIRAHLKLRKATMLSRLT